MIVVFGASGFVGSHVVTACRDLDLPVRGVSAPRIPGGYDARTGQFLVDPDVLAEYLAICDSASVVINCAGLPHATSDRSDQLHAANAGVPAYLRLAVERSECSRLVHVSSAAVQGRRTVLDSTSGTSADTPYAQSKALGERLLLTNQPDGIVVYRPPGVHGPDRPVTRSLVQLARSPLASVARPGTANSAQALIENVAAAVAFLATTAMPPPAIVHHPSEGLTVTSLLTMLGGKRPLALPRPVAAATVRTARIAGRLNPGLLAQARRLEVLWFGQDQAVSWLDDVGWTPPVDAAGWEKLGAQLRRSR